MAGINIQISGLADIEAALDQAVQQITSKVDEAVQTAGITCEAGAKQNCPVDTGRLRSSIHYQKTGTAACSVGTDVEYAWFQELGTARMASHAFLFPAFATASRNLMDELRQI